MKFIDNLCPPALLYALYVAIQLGLDAADFAWVTFAVKGVFGLATVFVLDLLCRFDLGIISWVFIATPFIVTALGTSIAMGLEIDRTVMSSL